AVVGRDDAAMHGSRDVPTHHEALKKLALIVRGADTSDRDLTPESAGLYAYASGFQATSKDDFDNMARQFPAYDALYVYCGGKLKPRP
ncbi:MAG TPA: chromate resistance protein ChrB domain-containing protein, partial [Alphaproteobacteria bacterium]|nr:chromate resistance protein ChrB domain-containing protein [Alphaproteobacteria bacterium]